MHTISEHVDGGLFVVGYYTPDRVWVPLQDCTTFGEAAALCSWLNGGLEPELANKITNAFKKGGAFR